MNKLDSEDSQSFREKNINPIEPTKSKYFEIHKAPPQVDRIATLKQKNRNEPTQGSVLEIVNLKPEHRQGNSTPQTNQFMEILEENHYEKKQQLSNIQRSLVEQDLLSSKQIDQEDNFIMNSPVQTAQYSGAGGSQKKILIVQIEKNINYDVIQKSLFRRGNWFLRQHEESIQLNWVEKKQQIYFKKLDQGKELVNHFEFEEELLDKLKLYQNVNKYCEIKHLAIDNFMLRQFNFDFESPLIKSRLANFNCLLKKSQQKQWEACTQKELEIQFSQQLKETNEWKKFQIFEGGSWILKITNLSGGAGVKFVDNYIDFRDIMRSYLKGKYEYINEFVYTEDGEMQLENYECQLVSSQFILQKYLSQPLLYQEKKFQITTFCLINHLQLGYVCNQLVMQIAEDKYDENNIENRNSHIIQSSDQFYLVDSINDLPFNILETYSQIKQITEVVCNSVSDLLNKENRKYCMQLFSFKFIVDASHQTYLIDINQNHFLKSKLDQNFNEIIPKIIDEALQLSVDQVYKSVGTINQKYWDSLS